MRGNNVPPTHVPHYLLMLSNQVWIKPDLRLVDELQTFEEITSKPRPLMNINEIRTKNSRNRLLIMGHLPPKYESHRPFGF